MSETPKPGANPGKNGKEGGGNGGNGGGGASGGGPTGGGAPGASHVPFSRFFRHHRNGKVYDAHDYGHKYWPFGPGKGKNG